VVIARTSNRGGDSDALTRRVADVRSGTCIAVVTRGVRTDAGSHAGEGESRRAPAGIGLRAGIPVVAEGTQGQIGVETLGLGRAQPEAAVLGAWIPIVATERIVPAGAGRRVAGVDRAGVEVVARGAGSFQGGGPCSCPSESEAEKRHGRQDGEVTAHATDGIGLHDRASTGAARGRLEAPAGIR